MRKLSSIEIKKNVLQILLELKKVCDSNNLTFYLCGGSLLGAVRHGGFIPWDDDIDVCMPRPDYDTLLKLSDHDGIFPNNIKLCCYSKKNSKYPFIKLIDTNTLFKQKYEKEKDIDSLWVDIFPTDGLPDSYSSQKRIYKKAKRIRKVLRLNLAKIGEGKTGIKKVLKPVVVPFARLIGYKKCNDKLNQLSKSYSFLDANYVGIIMWGLYGTGEIMKHSEFKEKVSVKFEGYDFNTMSCWDSYLQEIYGNYMVLPPKSERVAHQMEVWIKDDDEK